MKPLLITTLLVLAVCIGCYGQRATIKQSEPLWMQFTTQTYTDTLSATFYVDGNVVLRGDTMRIIKMLYRQLQKTDSLYRSLYKKVYPNPTTTPDTLPNKKIKNLDKMKPRKDSGGLFVNGWDVVTGTDSIDWKGFSISTNQYYPLPDPYGAFGTRPSQDTIKCLLLVSDTTDVGGFRSPRCYWMYGYRIREGEDFSQYDCYDKSGTPIPCPDNLLYLDHNKSPLNKSIVVWISKPVKE